MTSERLLVAALEGTPALAVAWAMSFLPIPALWRVRIMRIAFARLALTLVPPAINVVLIPASPSASSLGMALWLAGAGLCAHSMFQELRLMRFVVQSGTPMSDPALDQMASSMGLRSFPHLLVSNKVQAPLLVGLVRKFIVLPQDLVAPARKDERSMCFAHELAHMKNRDLPWGGFVRLVGAIFFFQPFVWLCLNRLSFLQEVSADEVAMRSGGQSPATYGRMLLDFVRVHDPRLDSFASLNASAGAKQMRRRLDALAAKPRTGSKAACLSAIMAACACLPFSVRFAAHEVFNNQPLGAPMPIAMRLSP
ncbi:MAG: M56 family metallopeptidase [Armatimonadetes bacterium]|nr:M56 family metallopeptidase [Armatimonadota bacterium]